MWGAAHAFHKQSGLLEQRLYAEASDHAEEQVRIQMGDTAFRDAFLESETVTLDQAVAGVEQFMTEHLGRQVSLGQSSVQTLN